MIDSNNGNGHGDNYHAPSNGDVPVELTGPEAGRRHAAAPRFAPAELIAAPPPEAAAPVASPPVVKQALGAFRRRWLLAFVLGLPVGAAAAAAAWFLISAPYTAFSEIRIKLYRQTLLGEEQRHSFEVYKQTQMRQVKDPFVLAAAIRPPEIANLSVVRSEDHPVDWLEEELDVSSPATEFIRISLSGEEPKELAELVNAITGEFVEHAIATEAEARRERIKKLESLQQQFEEDLRAARNKLKNLSEQFGGHNREQMNAKQQALLDLHIEIRKELAQVNFELLRLQIQLSIIEKEEKNEAPKELEIPDSVIDVHIADDPDFQSLSARVGQLEALVAQYEKIAAEGHPRRVAKEKELAAAKIELEQRRLELIPLVRQRLEQSVTETVALESPQLRRQMEQLQEAKASLERELEKAKFDSGAAGLATFEVDQQESEVERLETLEKQISDELQAARIASDHESGESDVGIELYRKADVPHLRDTKKKLMMTGAAGFGGFGLILVSVVWLELLTRRISAVSEVAEGLSLRILGAVPRMPAAVKRGRTSRNNARHTYWQNVLTESIDSTRTVLLRDARIEDLKCVMIASAAAGEGKTTLACHLGASMARAGRAVILVDCDLRRPSIHRVFDVPQTPGLCEMLRGEATLDDVLQSASPEGLTVIPAGKIDSTVLQKLAQDGLATIIEQIKQRYDFMLIDSAPVLPVTDSLLIAQHVDGVLFSIRRDISRAGKVAAACQRLAMLGVPLLGAVVIGLDDGLGGGSYGYRYGYGYGYGYGGRYGYGYVSGSRAS